jgi:hypothetical protein
VYNVRHESVLQMLPMDRDNMDKEREEIEKHRLETLQKLTGNNADDGDTTERIPSYLEFKAWYTYRRNSDDLDFYNSEFVRDNRYGRRMVYRSQSASNMPWIVRQIRRLIQHGNDSDESTDTGMTREQTRNNNTDASANRRSNPVLLGRGRAVRQASRRDAGTRFERHDSAVSVQTQLRNAQLSANVQHNKSFDENIATFGPSPAVSRPPTPVRNSSCSSEQQPAVVPPYTRRFSFEPIDRTSLNGQEAGTSHEHINSSNPRLPVRNQRTQGGQMNDTTNKRKIPTTFEEILGERGIPTALLSDYQRGGEGDGR